MSKTLQLEIDKILTSYETISSIESCVSNHDFHEYFFAMEDYIDSLNKKHGNCVKEYKNRIIEINESIDKIKNKINLLSDSLKKTINNYNNTIEIAESHPLIKVDKTQDTNVEFRKTLEENSINNDSSKEIVSVPAPTKEQTEKKPLIPDNYNTIPVGLGVGAAGITGSIGAVVIDSMIPKSQRNRKRNKRYEIDDNDINDYNDYEVADEAEEKPVESLRIDPSTTSYRAHRSKTSMKKFYEDTDKQ